MSRLSHNQYVDLTTWLRDIDINKMTGTPIKQAAAIATQQLGFSVAASSLTKAMDKSGVTWETPHPQKADAGARICLLECRINHLEAVMNNLLEELGSKPNCACGSPQP